MTTKSYFATEIRICLSLQKQCLIL